MTALLCLALLPAPLLAADQAKFEEGGLEFHYVLNNLMHIDEQYMPVMPDQVIEKLAPMFIVKPEGKHRDVMYIDTPDRKLRAKNLILRLRTGQLTVKVRGASPEAVADLPECTYQKSKKKYEVDYFSTPRYSISSSITFTPEKLDIAINRITPAKVGAFLEGACPELYSRVKDVLTNPAVVIPGTSNQYRFKMKLAEGYPLADNRELKAVLSIWYFTNTTQTFFELSFTGPSTKRRELEQLQEQTFKFLKERALLSSNQLSKTETFFKEYGNN